MDSGAFRNVEDVLLRALKSLSPAERLGAPQPKQSFAEFLLDSPLPGSGLNLEKAKDYPHTVEF